MYKIARTAVDMLVVNAEKHDVSLCVEGETAYILANRVMMEEIVYNLTGNAIRYNNQGGKVALAVYNNGERVLVLPLSNI